MNFENLRLEIENTAKFYPIVATKRQQNLFRFGARLKDTVQKDKLKVAVNETIARFPALKVTIKKGWSWHYLVSNPNEVLIFDGEDKNLSPIDPKVTNGYWFRVSARDNDVYIDMFHGITDGQVCVSFFKAFLVRYCELIGQTFADKSMLVDITEEPTQGEIEDSFLPIYEKNKDKKIDLKTLKGKAPFTLHGKLQREVDTWTASTDFLSIARETKRLGVTLTAYFVGMMAFTLDKMRKESIRRSKKKPISVLVPINLRAMFGSKTTRNFISFCRLNFGTDLVSLDDFVLTAGRQLADRTSKDSIENIVVTTIKSQSLFFMKYTPLIIKGMFIRLGRKIVGSRQTTQFSNLGKIELPEEFQFEKIYFDLCVTDINPQCVGVMSVGDKMLVTFTKLACSNQFRDELQKNLSDNGIELDVFRQ